MSADPRTPEQLRHHYEVEKELGDRLRRSTRAERKVLYQTLYDELFARVPDHPRLRVQETEESIAAGVRARFRLLASQLRGVETFVEFAPGDCRLAFAVCPHVKKVIAADISNQVRNVTTLPPNFEHVVYDGYTLPLADGIADMTFSYQFIEHLHPDDAELHFQTAARLLKPGGRYIFSTPHPFTGPHDISVYFSATPQGFHLKEWTYADLRTSLLAAGFSSVRPYIRGQPRMSGAALTAVLAGEAVLGALPRALRRRLAQWQYNSVIMIATK